MIFSLFNVTSSNVNALCIINIISNEIWQSRVENEIQTQARKEKSIWNSNGVEEVNSTLGRIPRDKCRYIGERPDLDFGVTVHQISRNNDYPIRLSDVAFVAV